MATLQINIDVNDEEFRDMCTNNINDLPKDKLQEILLQAVEVALIANKDQPYSNGDLLIIRNEFGVPKKATPLMEDIIKTIDTKKYLDPLAKEVIEYIQNNYKNIVKEYIVEAFTKMLFIQAKDDELTRLIMRDMH